MDDGTLAVIICRGLSCLLTGLRDRVGQQVEEEEALEKGKMMEVSRM